MITIVRCPNCGQKNRIPDPSKVGTYKCGAAGCGTVILPQIECQEIFEPALKHFPRAFRLSDPRFADLEVRDRWFNARRQAIAHLLQMINDSPWRECLVLRGSLLLKAWLGDVAREPGDIDWIFRPQEIELDNPLSKQLFDELIEMVSEHPRAGNTVIEVAKISVTDIWTYERAAGRRIVFPWKVEGLPAGDLQVDVVFGEELFAAPIQTLIPSSEGNGVLVWSADRELSLAWKLLWLETDMYPQGKDLYDATLLAEQTKLPFDLLHQVFRSSDWHSVNRLQPDFPVQWSVDWDNFKLEYPWVEGEAKDWQNRLVLALAPTFAPIDPSA
jgi:hypothetical protein